ncbi:MAG: serine hydrolase [Candidatus Komeilibacteria bacterium]
MTSFVQFCAAIITLLGLSLSQTPQLYTLVWHERAEPVGSVWTWSKQSTVGAPVKINRDSLGVAVAAPTAIIIDGQSGATLWEKNPADVRAIGSITKLMSVLVFLDHNPGWNTVVTITAADQANDGRSNFVVGEQIKVRDLLAASLIPSDNDATQTLARISGLSSEDFVKAMNDKARSLGMTQTVFTEPTGLSADNVSTAREVIVFAREAFARPEIAVFVSDKEYQFTSVSGQQHRLKSTNKLFGSIIGIKQAKTGFIDQAGHCMVAKVEDKGRIIFTAVLGAPTDADRFQDTKMLSYWAFHNWRWPQEANPPQLVL